MSVWKENHMIIYLDNCNFTWNLKLKSCFFNKKYQMWHFSQLHTYCIQPFSIFISYLFQKYTKFGKKDLKKLTPDMCNFQYCWLQLWQKSYCYCYCYNFFDQQNKWEKVCIQLLLQARDSGLLEEIQCQKKTEGGYPYNYAGLKELFKYENIIFITFLLLIHYKRVIIK